jgi:hypothetical protein
MHAVLKKDRTDVAVMLHECLFLRHPFRVFQIIGYPKTSFGAFAKSAQKRPLSCLSVRI